MPSPDDPVPITPLLVALAIAIAIGVAAGRRLAPAPLFWRRFAGAAGGGAATALLALLTAEQVRAGDTGALLVTALIAGPGLAALVPAGLAIAEGIGGLRPSMAGLAASAFVCVTAVLLWGIAFPVLIGRSEGITLLGHAAAVAAVAAWAAAAYAPFGRRG
jgi:hypothetical protein